MQDGCVVVIRVRRAGGERLELPIDKGTITVGRAAACELRLPDPAVSAVHARIEHKDGAIWIADTGSSNGTTIDGRPLGSSPVRLESGQTVRIASFQIEVLVADPTEALSLSPDTTGTGTLAARLVGEALGEGGRPRLSVETGPDAGLVMMLPEPGDTLVLGRAEELQPALSDPDTSRRHCEVRRDWIGATLVDLSSKNGTRRNGVRIEGEVRLADDDRIELGSTVLRYSDPAANYLDALDRSPDRPTKVVPEPGAKGGGGLPVVPLVAGVLALGLAGAALYLLLR